MLGFHMELAPLVQQTTMELYHVTTAPVKCLSLNSPETSRQKRTFYYMMPLVVEEMNLSPGAYRLYAHIRAVCGERTDGCCFKSTATLSSCCNMSTGAISRAKHELLTCGIIHIEKGVGTGSDRITLIDLWPSNTEHFTGKYKGDSVPIVNAERSNMETNNVSPPGILNPVSIKDTTTTDTYPKKAEVVVHVYENRRDAGLEDELGKALGSGSVARNLLRKFGVERCEKQLSWLKYRDATNPAALLAQAIRDDYCEPAKARGKREESEKRIELERRATILKIKQISGEKERKAAIEAKWATLSPEEQRVVIEKAQELVFRIKAFRGRMHMNLQPLIMARRDQIVESML